MRKISEDFIVNSVKVYLKKKHFVIKKTGMHGADIITDYHKVYRRKYIVEAKGEAGIKKSTGCPIKHNAFYYMLGQILSRMDKQGNRTNRGRIYSIAIPKKWTETFKKKIKEMPFAWKLLNLKVFLVNLDGDVEEKPSAYFLK